MTEITFPVSSADAIVNFYRTEILTGQEAKHFKKQRTLTILSAIMNFFYFRKQRMELILEKQAKYCAKKDSIAEGKAIFAEKTQKLAQVKVDISTLKEDIGKLKSQIVESPEELKSQMEKMRENVKNIKLSIEESDERVVELQNMVQSVTYTEAEIQQMYNLLQDLEISMNNSKQRQKEQLELTAQYERKQKELKNLCAEEGQLKRALAMKLDKESKQNIRRQKRKDMKEQHVQEVLGTQPVVQGSVTRSIRSVRRWRSEIQEITAETQQLKAKIQSLRDVCSKETERAQVRLRHQCLCVCLVTTVTLLCLRRLSTTLCPLPSTSCTGESRRTSPTCSVTSPRWPLTFSLFYVLFKQNNNMFTLL
ncbi:unnamed protein product [Tetraodon nigroviridis]|uniref:(spotted green pufferfish) hypothetical protein n=1 Tax=Tetraodon nigroviridis TaxID=99883 RepID=Q4SQW8_TETNG|nr:unnamed protein product [Tetraodon nigroviridis]